MALFCNLNTSSLPVDLTQKIKNVDDDRDNVSQRMDSLRLSLVGPDH